MKTSNLLLAIIALVTLTSMVATNVLLKQQYQRIDWRDPYQDFEKRALPPVKHWVVEGTSVREILVEKSTGSSQALLEPEYAKFYRIRQQGDTAFVAFTPDYSGYQNQPSDEANYELRVGLVLRLADIQTIRAKMARLTLTDLSAEKLQINLQNSRLRTQKLAITGPLYLQESQGSFATIGTYRLASLQAVVQDSSGVQLNNTDLANFNLQAAPNAKVYLRGQALKWVKTN